MEKILLVIVAVIGVIGLCLGLSMLLAWPTLWLMNYMFTSTALYTLFGVTKLTFWKAFWLNFLVGILFKSSNTTTKEK